MSDHAKEKELAEMLSGRRELNRKHGLSLHKKSLPDLIIDMEENELDRSLRRGIRSIIEMKADNQLSDQEMETMLSHLISLYAQGKVNLLVNKRLELIFGKVIASGEH